jgi:hypothetical protein
MQQDPTGYPVDFAVAYPDRPLNRMSTFFRLFAAVPIVLLLGTVSGWTWDSGTLDGAGEAAVASGGLLFFAPLLMIVFRRKYPRWWFDWNLELMRFSSRVSAYVALMDDRYPSTDEQQSVQLNITYPDAAQDLHRLLPLVKWFLAIPHYVVLFFLTIGAVVAVFFAWVAILFTGRYPRGLFTYVEGVMRWHNRVLGYAFLLITDDYPPMRLAA